MAFTANVVIVRRDYIPDTPEATKFEADVMSAATVALSHYGIKIEKMVNRSEYDKSTQSNKIGRYLRVRIPNSDDNYKMVKVGEGRYSSEVFASAKHAFVSISKMNDYIVIWFSFHSRLLKAIESFGDFTIHLSMALSRSNYSETMVMYTTSASRQSDIFNLYVNGRERNSICGKGALTEVKNTYDIDINNVMDNVDNNLAIYYAPLDFAEVQKDITEHKARHEAFLGRKIPIEGAVDKSKMEEENKNILESLNHKLSTVESALKAQPMGNVLFFKMSELERAQLLSKEERQFGRRVDLPK